MVTDPGSPLAERATAEGFRALFENPPDIGGRYSALSFFGLVPAAAAGLDVGELLSSADGAAAALADPDPAVNPGLRLGAALAGAVRAGRDKVTLVVDGEIDTIGLWLEQLLAESTGKQGTGVIPIAGERLGPPEVYGDDRLFVGIGEHHGLEPLAEAGHPVITLPSDGTAGLGALVLTWEVATALCGAALGINPFDQPNVAEAKAATDEVLAAGPTEIATTPAGRGAGPDRCRATTWPSRPTSTPRTGWSTPSRTPAPRSATASGSPPPSAWARGSCTRPASSTRGARPPACSSRWSATTPSTSPSPAGPTASPP